jgi:2-oxoisovalerate dehydrogenase E1 component alpha subunit
MGAHTTSDDPTKYRMSAEVEVWKLRDPIERLKAWLAHAGPRRPAFFDPGAAPRPTSSAPVRDGCLALPDPAGTDMFDHVYAEPHPVMERERAEFVALPGGFRGANHG